MAVKWITPDDTIDPGGEYTELAIEVASGILFKLTAEKYPGRQSVTESYVSNVSEVSTSITPNVLNGEIVNITRNSSLFNNGSRRLRLRNAPVIKINSIINHGTLMTPNSYQLRNNAFLVKTDGSPWILDSVSEIIVSYEYGAKPPAAGKLAAIKFANEIILSFIEPDNCSLPEKVTSIARQGVSWTVLDPQDYLSNGKLGLYLVDAFISAYNPNFAKKRPKIFSPDRPNGERIN